MPRLTGPRPGVVAGSMLPGLITVEPVLRRIPGSRRHAFSSPVLITDVALRHFRKGRMSKVSVDEVGNTP